MCVKVKVRQNINWSSAEFAHTVDKPIYHCIQYLTKYSAALTHHHYCPKFQQVYLTYLFMCLNITEWVANNADTDQMTLYTQAYLSTY